MFNLKNNSIDSISIYKKEADSGDATAMQQLGIIYLEGVLTEPNYEEAFRCFSQAVKYDDSLSQFYLGLCYKDGLGTQADQSLAEYFFTLSAVNGQAEAQFVLGVCFYERHNNFTEAKLWLDKSSGQGYKLAAEYMELIYEINQGEALLVKDPDVVKLQMLGETPVNIARARLSKIKYSDIIEIIYGNTLNNKVHFWRGSK